MLFEDSLRALIRERRRSWLFRSAAHCARRYLNAWYNTGFFDFDRNGERFVLETFAKIYGQEVTRVWDIGGFHGDYAVEAHKILPRAHITTFEILPQLADKIAGRNLDPAWFELRTIGLSDRPGSVDVHWHHGSDSTNSIHSQLASGLNYGDVEVITCGVSTIDSLVDGGDAPPHFVKIDVEGHEAAVLEGANRLLASESAPLMIQFEYGSTWIPARRTLQAVHAALVGFGYSVGRLYPDHVEFKPYQFSDDDFRMGNMVATKCPHLKACLS